MLPLSEMETTVDIAIDETKAVFFLFSTQIPIRKDLKLPLLNTLGAFQLLRCS